jgi:hypothetical protein
MDETKLSIELIRREEFSDGSEIIASNKMTGFENALYILWKDQVIPSNSIYNIVGRNWQENGKLQNIVTIEENAELLFELTKSYLF